MSDPAPIFADDGPLAAAIPGFRARPQQIEMAQRIAEALRGNREQYFVRVTANVPSERFWDDPGFAQVRRGLQSLGLAAAPSAAGTLPR